MRKAKIMCTLGSASSSREVIAELIRNGMDVARLNFSHGDHESFRNMVTYVREEAEKQKRDVSVIQDLQGIKIRINAIDGAGIDLNNGDTIKIYYGDALCTAEALYISYPAIVSDMNPGEHILMDDGLIKLRVTEKNSDHLVATVIEGGFLKSKKGVNLPDTKTTISSFTDKDRRDMRFGLELDVDFMAVSFIRDAADMKLIHGWAKEHGFKLPPLIAKIEKPEALDNIDEILELCDGIIVGRGDLGVEMNTEKVPMIQKSLIDSAARKGKLVITATQMLESMTQHTRPTRAEASDVANAILDGSDGLMLAAETASGKYPIEAVRTMSEIIKYTEEHSENERLCSTTGGNVFCEAVAEAACRAALVIDASAIVVFTRSGYTAQLVSKVRPAVPIIAFTPDPAVVRRFPMYWGTEGRLIAACDIKDMDCDMIKAAENMMLNEGLVKKGDRVVCIAFSPFPGEANIMRLHQIL